MVLLLLLLLIIQFSLVIAFKGPLRRVRSSVRMAAQKPVLALDFDGVVCASSPESAYSSLIAARLHWEGNCDVLTTEEEPIRETVMKLRPIVETGYENMLLVRLAMEELREKGSVDSTAMLERWTTTSLKEDALMSFGDSSDDLIKVFGECRDRLMREDLQKWVSLNEIFPWVKTALQSLVVPDNMYIITTKQGRFVRAIMKAGGLPPPARLFDLDNPYGPKSEVLKAILREAKENGSIPEIHFVEDRVETLLSVVDEPSLNGVQLYLVDWGYSTEEQRQVGQDHPRIQVIDRDQFQELVDRCCVAPC
jgi:hypothetical protein